MKKVYLLLISLLAVSLLVGGCVQTGKKATAGKAVQLYEREVELAKETFDVNCMSGAVADGIQGSHNYKLITSFWLTCDFGGSSFDAGKGRDSNYIKPSKNDYVWFGPDKCSGKLTGLNLYPKTGQVTRITKICDGVGKDSNAKVLECANGITGIQGRIDSNGFIHDITDVQCKGVVAAGIDIPSTEIMKTEITETSEFDKCTMIVDQSNKDLKKLFSSVYGNSQVSPIDGTSVCTNLANAGKLVIPEGNAASCPKGCKPIPGMCKCGDITLPKGNY